MKQRTILMKNIAERAGVSPGTVSLVLNDRGDELRISKATQLRVKEVAKELNYQPNIYARRLRNTSAGEASKVIAVFWSTELMDDMLGRFFTGLQKVAAACGHNVEFFIQLFEFDKLSEYKDIMNSSRFSGIILSGVSDYDTEFVNKTTFDIPVVLINRNEERYHFVYINDYEIGKSVAKLFYSRNHKHVGLVSMNRKGHGAKMRQIGYLDNCEKFKLEIRPEWIDEVGERDYASGYQATHRILQYKEKPDAIFVMSYGQVLGAVEAIKDTGLKIPEDIEIITYGDSKTLQYYSPSISSVYVPVETLAENALNLLILVIDNGIEIPMSRMLYADYVFRNSCGRFVDDSEKTI